MYVNVIHVNATVEYTNSICVCSRVAHAIASKDYHQIGLSIPSLFLMFRGLFLFIFDLLSSSSLFYFSLLVK